MGRFPAGSLKVFGALLAQPGFESPRRPTAKSIQKGEAQIRLRWRGFDAGRGDFYAKTISNARRGGFYAKVVSKDVFVRGRGRVGQEIP